MSKHLPLPARPCTYPGCSTLVREGGRRCPAHLPRITDKAAADSRRGDATQRGYTAAWRKARGVYLSGHPLCAQCEREGRVTAAYVVDHIIPHLGDMRKFWEQSNWEALCGPHHNTKTASEDGGYGNPRRNPAQRGE